MASPLEDSGTAAHIADSSDHGVVMSHRIATQWQGARCVGRAFTVETPPGDNASLHEAIDQVSEGDVIVVDGKGFHDRALWGAIMSQAAMLAGVEGLVVEGAVRDVHEIREMGFPVFASGRTPAGPYNKVRGRIGAAIQCGDVTVRPGDLIYADDDGVVVVPLESESQVLARARRRHELETEIIDGLRGGESLSSLLHILRRSAATGGKQSSPVADTSLKAKGAQSE